MSFAFEKMRQDFARAEAQLNMLYTGCTAVVEGANGITLGFKKPEWSQQWKLLAWKQPLQQEKAQEESPAKLSEEMLTEGAKLLPRLVRELEKQNRKRQAGFQDTEAIARELHDFVDLLHDGTRREPWLREIDAPDEPRKRK